MRIGLGRRVLLYLVPLLGALLYKMWFGTCTIRSHGIEKRYAAEKRDKPLIGICWHYCVLSIFAIIKGYPMTMMISASDDGELLARMVERLGFPVVRGSSNRQGARAAKEMIRELRKGKYGGLVADGSQGPAMIAQSGSVFLAAKSGGIIVPMLYSASKYYSFKTWDRLILPKLFSTIDVFYGEPIILPEGVRASDLDEYRQQLERNLNELYTQAWQLHGKNAH